VTLFWDKTGPLVYYTQGTFGIEDLNPQAKKMRWKMSRWEVFKMGFRCLRAAAFGERRRP